MGLCCKTALLLCIILTEGHCVPKRRVESVSAVRHAFYLKYERCMMLFIVSCEVVLSISVNLFKRGLSA